MAALDYSRFDHIYASSSDDDEATAPPPEPPAIDDDETPPPEPPAIEAPGNVELNVICERGRARGTQKQDGSCTDERARGAEEPSRPGT